MSMGGASNEGGTVTDEGKRDPLRHPRQFIRGPYGTNLGDIWSAEDSEIGRLLKERDNLVLIHEVLDKGDGNGPQEVLYNVEENNPDPEMQDLIRRAREGRERWIAQRASEN